MRARVIVLAFWAAALSAKACAGVLIVTSNADAGPGTLRSAITEAVNGDRIAFALPAGATIITLAGPLAVSASPLAIDADSEAGTVTLTGGALPIGRGLSFTIGSGRVFVLDTALTGDGSTAGLVVSGGGTVHLGPAAQLPASSPLKLEGGTIDLGSHDQRVGGLSGENGKVLLGTATLTVDQDGDTAFGGTIEGAGALAKTGAGRLTLTRPQAWTGGTRVAGGILELSGNGSTLRVSGSIAITGGELIAPGIRMGVPSR